MIDLTLRDFGQCPNCGEYGEYDGEESVDYETIQTQCHCPQCNATWREFEKRVPDGFAYDGKIYDKTGYSCGEE